VVKVAEPGHGHGGVGDGVPFQDRDAGAEQGVAARVVRRAVHGVEEPGAPGLGDPAAPLLGEDGVLGVALPDGVNHELLAEEIHLGDDVLGGLLRYLARIVVARELQLSGSARYFADELVEFFGGV
jgi:hypothetical protein